jgi:antitoxin ParD1/3/4
MATLNISIPDALKRQIDAQVAAGYADASAYIVDLIESDVREREAVLAALAQGEASGTSAVSPEQILEELLRARLAA